MSRYLVTLKPVDKFFFGGDMTFEVAGKKEHNQMFKSYIIESALFPQQTSLLGMMRFLLLRKSDCFDGSRITDADKASALIGSHSFEVGCTDGFGKIKSMTGCFIRDRLSGEDYAFAPFCKDFIVEDTGLKGIVNGIQISLPEIKGYTAKDGYTRCLVSRNTEIKLDNVFVKDRRIGINRNIDTGLTEESALFKQISYRFNDFDKDNCTRLADYCFAFHVEVDDLDLTSPEYDGEVVSLGADGSQFIIHFEKDGTDNRPESVHETALVIQSPSYLSRDAVRLSSFFMTETVPFRFLKTSVKGTDNYTVYSNTLKRSEKYELYAPGSVFFFQTESMKEQFVSKLKYIGETTQMNEFARIGFNEYRN